MGVRVVGTYKFPPRMPRLRIFRKPCWIQYLSETQSIGLQRAESSQFLWTETYIILNHRIFQLNIFFLFNEWIVENNPFIRSAISNSQTETLRSLYRRQWQNGDEVRQTRAGVAKCLAGLSVSFCNQMPSELQMLTRSFQCYESFWPRRVSMAFEFLNAFVSQKQKLRDHQPTICRRCSEIRNWSKRRSWNSNIFLSERGLYCVMARIGVSCNYMTIWNSSSDAILGDGILVGFGLVLSTHRPNDSSCSTWLLPRSRRFWNIPNWFVSS
jgi:hypothetical protein